MTKQELIKELEAFDCKPVKIKFYAISPYQKKRYKPEFVGWEAWLYKSIGCLGFVLTQEDFENKEYLKDYLEAFKN